VQTGIPGPYPVSYRAIVPKMAECENLLVPVSLSSSHIAYGSIRMEPVFMVLGQSAATAAAMAIDANVPVQRVEYDKLKARLLADKQMLVWTGPVRVAGGNGGGAAGVKASSLPGIVVDDVDAKFEGEWSGGNTTRGFVGDGYRHDGADRSTVHTATFALPIKEAGTYDVRMSYSPLGNRASNVPVTVSGFAGEGGKKTVKVNEKQAPPIDKLFISLGQFKFEAGATATVEVSNQGADGHVIVDAAQALPVK
jgi:hypothetical protein